MKAVSAGTKGENVDRWLETDAYMETITSLEMLCEQLPKIVDDVRRWKWVVISLHNSLQGCMILALRGSNTLDVRTEDHRKKWLKAFRTKSGNYPRLYIDKFMHLYEKIQNVEVMKRYINSQPFEPSGTKTKSVEMLNEIRNEFIHFFPMNRTWDVSEFPTMVRDCIDIIDFLAFKSGNVLWDESRKARTKELVEEIRSLLKEVSEGCYE